LIIVLALVVMAGAALGFGYSNFDFLTTILGLPENSVDVRAKDDGVSNADSDRNVYPNSNEHRNAVDQREGFLWQRCGTAEIYFECDDRGAR